MGILSMESNRVVERFLMIFYFDHQFRFVEVGGFGVFLRSVAVRFASSNLSGAYSLMKETNSLYFSSSGIRRSAFCNSEKRFSRSLSVIFFSSSSRLYSVINPISIFFNLLGEKGSSPLIASLKASKYSCNGFISSNALSLVSTAVSASCIMLSAWTFSSLRAASSASCCAFCHWYLVVCFLLLPTSPPILPKLPLLNCSILTT